MTDKTKKTIEKMKALIDFSPKYHDYKIGRKWHRSQTNRPPRVTLASMAEVVNEIMEGHIAEIKEGYYSGDSHISGTRFRREGKDYHGKQIIITDKTRTGERSYMDIKHNVDTGKIVLDHNSAEPYRKNEEVARWILDHIERT